MQLHVLTRACSRWGDFSQVGVYSDVMVVCVLCMVWYVRVVKRKEEK